MKINDFPSAVIKENVDYTVKEITNVIKKYGPRESGNNACYDAEKHIKKELDQFCDETHFEEYKMAPKAFLHFTKSVSVLIILAVIAGFAVTFALSLPDFFIAQCVSGVAVAIGLFVTAMEFLMYKQFTDVLYRKKVTAHNLVGVRKPKGEVKKRIVISGHIDAAYEWRHIYYIKGRGMVLSLVGAIVVALISFVIAVISVAAHFADMGAFGDFMLNYSFYFNVITVLFMISLFVFVDFNTISPGANDNLTGTYAAVCALRMLDMAGVELENTEVVCMITDGEEAGLRGAKAFAKAHKEEYTDSNIKTAVLCCDTLTDVDYLSVYSKDMTGTVNHDKKFSQIVLDSAKEAGLENVEFSKVYFGASDAAAFTKEGIAATCLAEMDPTPADYYHNRRDNYDRLVPQAIENGYKTILASIFNFDALD
ncbi:MAG: M20/M25/M40 family metallo-hydrolase [Clostridiales bacterium]|nr:M20/M25/M40 family metallo-hydrolase [Clostridiales bacterium]